MKLLHTSDWHLGQRFINQDRGEEHALFLDWLLEIIREREVDALLVAGDVFDTTSPSNSALRQYYDFLTRLLREAPRCCNVIIVGGNHDSPATLEAPRSLLEAINVRVVGCARLLDGQLDTAAESVELRDPDGKLLGLLAAVPFLRDRDLKYSVAGETQAEREASIREGIGEHYRLMREALWPRAREAGLPLIASGHLYAAGASLGDSEKEIHLGNLGRVSADSFPAEFSYLALGHLHKAQRVGGQARIHYAGSPLPLSFAEAGHGQSVLLVTFQGEELTEVAPVEVPRFRQLLRWRGDPDSLLRQIAEVEKRQAAESLTPWVEISLESARARPRAAHELREAAVGRHLEILKVVLEQSGELGPDQTENAPDLESLHPREVFRRLCQGHDLSEAHQRQLEQDFELLQAQVLEEINPGPGH